MSVGSLSSSADLVNPETEDEKLFGISVVSDALDASMEFVAESCASEEERPCAAPEEERPCAAPEEEEERPCAAPEEERPCAAPEEEEERPCAMDDDGS